MDPCAEQQAPEVAAMAEEVEEGDSELTPRAGSREKGHVDLSVVKYRVRSSLTPKMHSS